MNNLKTLEEYVEERDERMADIFFGETTLKKKTASEWAEKYNDFVVGMEEINHPNHYTVNKNGNPAIEVDDFIDSWEMEWRQAAIVKYVVRYNLKGAPLKDLRKARWYLNKMIEKEEAKVNEAREKERKNAETSISAQNLKNGFSKQVESMPKSAEEVLNEVK